MNLPVVYRKDWLKWLVVYLIAMTLPWLSESQFCFGTGLALCPREAGPSPVINDEMSKPVTVIPVRSACDWFKVDVF